MPFLLQLSSCNSITLTQGLCIALDFSFTIIASQFANLFVIIKVFLFYHSPSNAKMRGKIFFFSFIRLQCFLFCFFYSFYFLFTIATYIKEEENKKKADFNMQMQLNFIDEFTTQSRAF